MTDVYISHRAGASGYAYPLLDALRERLGDSHVRMRDGDESAGLPRCDAMIVLIDRGWTARADPVHTEVATALRRGVRLIPVLVQGATMPQARDLPGDLAPLAGRNNEILREEAWNRDLDHLAEMLAGLTADHPAITAANGARLRLARRIPTGVPAVTSLAFAPDGQTVLAGGSDGTVRVLRVSDGMLSRSIRAHADRITALSITPDGRTVATASTDPMVRTWDAGNGTARRQLDGSAKWVAWAHRRFSGGVLEVVFALSISPAGDVIAAGQGDGAVRLWWLADDQFRKRTGHKDRVTGLDFSPDGRLIASASWDGTVLIRSVADGSTVLKLTDPHLPDPRPGLEMAHHLGPSWAVSAVRFSPDGRFLATASGNGFVRVWRAADGAAVLAIEGHDRDVMSSLRLARGLGLGEQVPMMGGVRAVAYAPDGSVLASGADDHTVRLWHGSTGASLQILSGHTGGVTSVAFSPDGSLLASGAWDGDVRLWAL
jgi:WD40 repeat protein